MIDGRIILLNNTISKAIGFFGIIMIVITIIGGYFYGQSSGEESFSFGAAVTVWISGCFGAFLLLGLSEVILLLDVIHSRLKLNAANSADSSDKSTSN